MQSSGSWRTVMRTRSAAPNKAEMWDERVRMMQAWADRLDALREAPSDNVETLQAA